MMAQEKDDEEQEQGEIYGDKLKLSLHETLDFIFKRLASYGKFQQRLEAHELAIQQLHNHSSGGLSPSKFEFRNVSDSVKKTTDLEKSIRGLCTEVETLKNKKAEAKVLNQLRVYVEGDVENRLKALEHKATNAPQLSSHSSSQYDKVISELSARIQVLEKKIKDAEVQDMMLREAQISVKESFADFQRTFVEKSKFEELAVQVNNLHADVVRNASSIDGVRDKLDVEKNQFQSSFNLMSRDIQARADRATVQQLALIQQDLQSSISFLQTKVDGTSRLPQVVTQAVSHTATTPGLMRQQQQRADEFSTGLEQLRGRVDSIDNRTRKLVADMEVFSKDIASLSTTKADRSDVEEAKTRWNDSIAGMHENIAQLQEFHTGSEADLRKFTNDIYKMIRTHAASIAELANSKVSAKQLAAYTWERSAIESMLDNVRQDVEQYMHTVKLEMEQKFTGPSIRPSVKEDRDSAPAITYRCLSCDQPTTADQVKQLIERSASLGRLSDAPPQPAGSDMGRPTIPHVYTPYPVGYCPPEQPLPIKVPKSAGGHRIARASSAGPLGRTAQLTSTEMIRKWFPAVVTQ